MQRVKTVSQRSSQRTVPGSSLDQAQGEGEVESSSPPQSSESESLSSWPRLASESGAKARTWVGSVACMALAHARCRGEAVGCVVTAKGGRRGADEGGEGCDGRGGRFSARGTCRVGLLIVSMRCKLREGCLDVAGCEI